MQKLLTLLISGAASGMIYSLIAVGLVLTFSATGIFNLAFGGVAYCAAFLYYELRVGLEWSQPIAAIASILVAGPLLGLVLDVAVFRPLARASEAAKIMATVGLLVALPAIARYIVEILVNVFDRNLPLGDQVYLPPNVGPAARVQWTLPGGGLFDSNQLLVLIAAVTVSIGLWLLLRYTRLGLQMRATVDRPVLAEMRGIDTAMMSRRAWVIGTTLAALAGVVGAPVLGSLDASTYTVVVFVATAAAIGGRLTSIPIAFTCGMGLGVAQNLVAGYVPLARTVQGLTASVPFILLLGGLLVLGRSRARVAGSISMDAPPTHYNDDLSLLRRIAPGAIALACFVLYLAIGASQFWLGVISRGLVVGVILLSFVVVTGMGGMVSLSQAAFVTVAGLVAGWSINEVQLPWLGALAVGTIAAIILGAVVALPALRLGGLALALATLALAFMGDRVLFPWEALSGGPSGWPMSRPAVGPIDLADERTFAFVVLAVATVIIVLIGSLSRSRIGRAMIALRNTEAGAAAAGVSPMRTKFTVFSISAGIAGLGGVLLATHAQNANALANPPTVGLLWLSAAVLIGIRRPLGAMVAGVSTVVFPQILSNGLHWPSFVPDRLDWAGTSSIWVAPILFGLGAIQLARNPDGLASMFAKSQRRRRDRRRTSKQSHSRTTDCRLEIPAPRSAIPWQSTETLDGLVVTDLAVGYDGSEVLHGIDFVIPKGEIAALLGPNGAGKSTLCNSLSGSLEASRGDVAIGGISLGEVKTSSRPSMGLVVAPESRGIFPGLSVDENLRIWLPRSDDVEKVYARFAHLHERRTTPAGALSGGEQQILALAPLLIRPPRVLVADEPTLGLAPTMISQLSDLFTEMRDSGITILLVEEKAAAVLHLADTVMILNLGRVSWAGKAGDADDEILRCAYLGVAGVSR